MPGPSTTTITGTAERSAISMGKRSRTIAASSLSSSVPSAREQPSGVILAGEPLERGQRPQARSWWRPATPGMDPAGARHPAPRPGRRRQGPPRRRRPRRSREAAARPRVRPGPAALRRAPRRPRRAPPREAANRGRRPTRRPRSTRARPPCARRHSRAPGRARVVAFTSAPPSTPSASPAGRPRSRRRSFALPFAPAPTALSASRSRDEENPTGAGFSSDAPGEIRTPDLRFRRPTLYPAELRALMDFLPARTAFLRQLRRTSRCPCRGQKPANTGEYVPANRPRAQNRSGGHRARITPASSPVCEALGGTRNRI